MITSDRKNFKRNDMNDFEMERKLAESGFTEKNIIHMRKIISRAEDTKKNHQTLLNDLNKRLRGGVFCVLLLLLILMVQFFCYGRDEIIISLFVVAFGLFVIYYITPLNLAWKAARFINVQEKGR